MSSQPTTTPRWSLISLLSRLMTAITGTTSSEVIKPRYAVRHCVDMPHAQSFTPRTFECLIQDIDLDCTVRAIALCKRTDGFQHETLIAIISLPGESEEALAFLERAGSWHETYSMRNYSDLASGSSLEPPDPSRPQSLHRNSLIAKDIITLLPESSLYWRYDHRSPQPPFHELPQIIKNSSTSRPLPQTFVKQAEQPDSAGVNGESKGGALRLFKGLRRPQQESSEDQPSVNSKADHAYIYAITFPEGGSDPPTVLDLAIAFKLVSEHRQEYNVARHNCYFFAAAICKVMAQKFGGKKVGDKEFHESQPPTSDNLPFSSATEAGTYEHQWLRKAGVRPVQILRDNDPYLNRMVETLCKRFKGERDAHRVIRHQKELQARDAQLRELSQRNQELEHLHSPASATTNSYYY